MPRRVSPTRPPSSSTSLSHAPPRTPSAPGAQWDHVVQVNLLGTAAVVRAALPASRGRIVTVASTLGLRALSDASAYCAS